MRIAQKFTPEVMLSAPRRSPAVPNHDGTLALYTVTTYDFAEGQQSKELKVAEIQTGCFSHVLSDDDSLVEALWLPGSSKVMCLTKGEQGTTRLVLFSATELAAKGRVIAEFGGPLTGMKLKRV